MVVAMATITTIAELLAECSIASIDGDIVMISSLAELVAADLNRVDLMSKLKEHGVRSLQHRQRMANALSKAQREGRLSPSPGERRSVAAPSNVELQPSTPSNPGADPAAPAAPAWSISCGTCDHGNCARDCDMCFVSICEFCDGVTVAGPTSGEGPAASAAAVNGAATSAAAAPAVAAPVPAPATPAAPAPAVAAKSDADWLRRVSASEAGEAKAETQAKTKAAEEPEVAAAVEPEVKVEPAVEAEVTAEPAPAPAPAHVPAPAPVPARASSDADWLRGISSTNAEAAAVSAGVRGKASDGDENVNNMNQAVVNNMNQAIVNNNNLSSAEHLKPTSENDAPSLNKQPVCTPCDAQAAQHDAEWERRDARLLSLLEAAQLLRLADVLRHDSLGALLELSRLQLLEHLKQRGVSKLPDRQVTISTLL